MTPRRVRTLASLIVLALISVAWADGPAKKPPPAPASGLAKPDYLSELARQLLRRRMGRHGRDTATLVKATVLLQRDLVHELALAIVNEPRITRPLPTDSDELNTALPEQFFVRQDELRDRARALATAAKGGTDDEVASRVGELLRTCVGCHAAYLEPSPPTQ